MFRGNNPNAFTPNGRLLQMQYALEASKMGASSFGICTQEVLILAAEKRNASPLMVAGSLDKIAKVDHHLYCTIAGLPADARSMIAPARVACCNHRLHNSTQMPIDLLMESMSRQATSFGLGAEDTLNSSSSSSSDSDSNDSSSSDSNEESDDENRKLLTTCRPYGAAFLFGGVNTDQLQLWHLEPTGEFHQVGIKAIGSGSDAADNWLVRHYQPNMNESSAKSLAVSTMQVLIGVQRLTPAHLDLMLINKEPRCHLLSEKELEQEIVRHQGLRNY